MKGDNFDIWKKVFLKYLDFDDSGRVDWWEYLIPITIILAIEVVAELIGSFIANLYL